MARSGDPVRRRDHYRLAVRAVTGITGVGVFTGAGWIALAQAADFQATQAAERAAHDSAVAAHAQEQADYEASLVAFGAAQGAVESAETPSAKLAPAPAIITRTTTAPRVTASFVDPVETTVGNGGDVGAASDDAGGNASRGGKPDPQPDPQPDPPPPPPPPPSSGS